MINVKTLSVFSICKCMLKIKNFFPRFWLGRTFITRRSCQLVGFIYTICGFLSVWFSFSDCLPMDWSFWYKLLFSTGVLLGISIMCCIVVTWLTLSQTKKVVLTSNSGHKVYVQYGDMYSSSIVSPNYEERRNIVVSVNRCFDTIVDNDLVSDKSQHGRIMNEMYAKRLYTPKTLNEKIQEKLRGEHYVDLARTNKSKGNTFRYDVGTIAEIQGDNPIIYFFLGLTKFDSHFMASTSKDEFVLAIQKLIEYCNTRSQGYPIVMPLIGSNLARTDLSQKDILNYLIQAFKINREKISADIHIVIWEGDKDKISIHNL